MKVKTSKAPKGLVRTLSRTNKEKRLEVIAGAPNKPLTIGGITIPCYVLEGEIRVLVQRQLQLGIGMSSSGGVGGAHRPAIFFEKLAEKDRRIKKSALSIAEHLRNPIEFVPPAGGPAYGYRANLLVDICEVVLKSLRLGILHNRQIHIAERCEILIGGFARIGIDALIDEATGYQEQRSKKALADALEKYLGDLDKHSWIKTFPIEFYKEIFRLRKWKWTVLPNGKKPYTPRVVGKFTNDVIYKRIIPGFPRALLDELEKVNPRDQKTGARKHKHHQWFTIDEGLPLLRERINQVTGMMMGAKDWKEFQRTLRRRFPRTGDQGELLND